MQHRRREPGQPGHRASRESLPAGLAFLGRGAHQFVAAQRVGLGHRQIDEQRGDLVAELAVVSLAADVHRHHRAQALARRVFAASEQQCA